MGNSCFEYKNSKQDLAAAEEETENLSRDLDAVERELEQERNAKTGTYPISHKNILIIYILKKVLETKLRRSEDARDDLEREVEGLRDELASRNNDGGGGEAGSTTSGIPNMILKK